LVVLTRLLGLVVLTRLLGLVVLTRSLGLPNPIPILDAAPSHHRTDHGYNDLNPRHGHDKRRDPIGVKQLWGDGIGYHVVPKVPKLTPIRDGCAVA
jgi:hypothetical protein